MKIRLGSIALHCALALVSASPFAHGQTASSVVPASQTDNALERILSQAKRNLDGHSGPFTLLVEVTPAPGKGEAVVAAYARHAAASRLEPGVGPFEIGKDLADPGRLLLYETYSNFAAFDRHVRAERTREFVADTNELIASRVARLIVDVTRAEGGATAPASLILELNRVGEEVRLSGVQVRVDEANNVGIRRVVAKDLVRPDVAAYTWANSGSTMVLGVPHGLAVPRHDRAGVLTDDVLNSGLFNVSERKDDALLLQFKQGLVNGRGPDLIIAELGTSVGQMYMDTPAPGGDRFTVAAITEDGQRHEKIVNPSEYLSFGSLGRIDKYGVADPKSVISSVSDLDRADVKRVGTADNLFLYAVAIDLSDLGVPAGARVRDITLQAMPLGRVQQAQQGSSTSEPKPLYFLDPVFVAGLPAL